MDQVVIEKLKGLVNRNLTSVELDLMYRAYMCGCDEVIERVSRYLEELNGEQ